MVNNADCLNRAGEEYVNYAIITKSGNSQAPADPLRQTLATFSTGPDTLEMNSDDQLIGGPARHACRLPGRHHGPHDSTRLAR